jgi:DNA-binding response OmpR family regulator
MMSGKKILIADYDKDSLESLSELFRTQGLEVIPASDGQAAYDLYKSKEPDVILIEAMLPKIHGFDLTKVIHDETEGALPVIILTGLYKGSQYRNEALRFFGAADYFEKPYDKGKLMDSVLYYIRDEQDLDVLLPSPEKVIGLLKKHLEEPS